MVDVINCMALAEDAHKLGERILNRNQFIMLIGTMFDEWCAVHNIDEDEANDILDTLKRLHNEVYRNVGAFQL